MRTQEARRCSKVRRVSAGTERVPQRAWRASEAAGGASEEPERVLEHGGDLQREKVRGIITDRHQDVCK